MYGSLSSARLASPEDCCTRAAGGYHVDWRSRKYRGGSAAIEGSPERSVAALGQPFFKRDALFVAQPRGTKYKYILVPLGKTCRDGGPG